MDPRASAADPPAAGGLWADVAAAFGAGRDDAGTVDDLVRLMTPVLWQVARACRLDEDDAADAVQTVWLALVRDRDRIADPRAVAGWLITATRREAWRLARPGRSTPVADPQDLTEPRPVTVADPSARAIAEEDDRLLWQAVQTLPERCRRLLRIVAFVERPDYRRIGADLGMPVGSIGPTRSRCLSKLRLALVGRS